MKWFLRISFTVLAVLSVLIIITTWRIFNPPHISDLPISDIVSSEPVTFENLKTIMC